MKSIKLMGALGEKFGQEHFLEVSSPAEAIRAFMANYPTFKKHLLDSDSKGVGYHVMIGDQYVKDDIELIGSVGKNDITFIPVLTGGGATVRIIGGAFLVAFGAILTFIPGAQAVGPYVIALGVGLILGGIVQLLTPIPKIGEPPERPENKPSYLFSGVVNTTAQGQPVQLLYGHLIVGSAIISAGISVEEIPVDS